VIKNLDYLKKLNINTNKLISLGGGSKSNVWNQIKADVIGKNIIVTCQDEPALLGAAIMAAVKLGLYKDINDAVNSLIKTKKVYCPLNNRVYEKQYRTFLDLYNRLWSEPLWGCCPRPINSQFFYKIFKNVFYNLSNIGKFPGKSFF